MSSAEDHFRVQQDSDEDRLAFVLAGQQHADHFLTPIADPAGKRVLVLGCGAGTDVLWCLRRGAVEVIGVDLVEQDRSALDSAARHFGVDTSVVEVMKLPLEKAGELGRRFDLVLANNVFEHVRELAAAFLACVATVEPVSGRVAVFSSPLFYSSGGSHLSHEPWAHLSDPDTLKQKLIEGGDLSARHPLRHLDLRTYLEDEITLNRAKLQDFVDAIAKSGLVPIHFGIVADPRLAALADAMPRISASGHVHSVLDLGVAGVSMELVLPGHGASTADYRSTAEVRLERERATHGREVEHRAIAEAEAERWRMEAAALSGVLRSVENSLSFRLGRALTAPGRWLARRFRRGVA